MLGFFTNLDFVLRRVSGHSPAVVIAAARNPSAADISNFPHPNFEFAGFDIVDARFTASALLNGCNFPEAFDVSELSSESGTDQVTGAGLPNPRCAGRALSKPRQNEIPRLGRLALYRKQRPRRLSCTGFSSRTGLSKMPDCVIVRQCR